MPILKRICVRTTCSEGIDIVHGFKRFESVLRISFVAKIMRIDRHEKGDVKVIDCASESQART